MLNDNDSTDNLVTQVQTAIDARQPLYIRGGDSKRHYANWNEELEQATPLQMGDHQGVINYEPSELAITVRAGTRLLDLIALLEENRQMLPFEPPIYSPHSTIGGAVAAGIAGPRAPYTGTARDAVLGVRLINGEGQVGRFGGEVMKNVAGYDVSRLMAKSWGTLGVILDTSLRLLPKPERDTTVALDLSQQEALELFLSLRQQQQPVSATLWYAGRCHIRFSGSENTVKLAVKRTGGELLEMDHELWESVRDHTHPFFDAISDTETQQKAIVMHGKPLWKIVLPSATPTLHGMDDNLLIEWGGAQRWIYTNTPPNIIHGIAAKHAGYATLISNHLPGQTRFTMLDPVLLRLHQQLKRNLDPHGIFNPGRIYEGL